MSLNLALVLTLIFFLIFLITAHFLARLTKLSSLVLAFLFSIFTLLLIYPPTQLSGVKPDASLWIYISFILFGIITSIIYILYYGLTDNSSCQALARLSI